MQIVMKILSSKSYKLFFSVHVHIPGWHTKIDQNQIVKDWPPQSPDLNPIEKTFGMC